MVKSFLILLLEESSLELFKGCKVILVVKVSGKRP